jgi:hypothetical protein
MCSREDMMPEIIFAGKLAGENNLFLDKRKGAASVWIHL